MKILALSDLVWNDIKVEGNPKYFEKIIFSKQIPNTDSYYFLKQYIQIIEKEKPDLILLCGDLADGGQIFLFSSLLKVIENKKITTLFISGNHDLDQPNYNVLVKKISGNKYIVNCDSKMVLLRNGFKIAGLSYSDTASKKRLKKLAKNLTSCDIIFSHCEYGRRLSLLDLPTNVILTGHFDNYIVEVEGKILVALGCHHFLSTDNISYLTLKYVDSKIDFIFNHLGKAHFFQKVNGSFYRKFPAIMGSCSVTREWLESSMRLLYRLKQEKAKIKETDINQLYIAKSAVIDYLGKRSIVYDTSNSE